MPVKKELIDDGVNMDVDDSVVFNAEEKKQSENILADTLQKPITVKETTTAKLNEEKKKSEEPKKDDKNLDDDSHPQPRSLP